MALIRGSVLLSAYFLFQLRHFFCRWVNALDPKIDKGAWTKIQDQKLLENVEKFGQGKQQVVFYDR